MTNKVVAFGEILLRLTPQYGRCLEDTPSFDCCYGGTEANVLISLSALGNQTSYITVLPDNSLGYAAEKHLHRYEVDTKHILRKGSILGSYFLEPGFGKMQSKVIYNRKNSEIASIEDAPKLFDIDEILSECSLFHISGISFALSESCRNLCFRFLEKAKELNIPISFDFNYRKSLWKESDAKEIYRRILPYVDMLFCSSLDLRVFLDTTPEEFFSGYHCAYLIRREREILSNARHRVYAEILHHTDHGTQHCACSPFEIEVKERIGTGDAFSAGVLHSLMKKPEDIEGALSFGMACFELKHYIPGDVMAVTEKEICDFIENQNKDVGR